MDEPGGTPGSGWDVSLDLSGVAGTPAAPSPAGGSAFGGTPGDAALPGGKRGERPRRTSPESPLLAGADASSSSSGSPDENDRARSNPPSPRGASPRGDALERGAPDDAPSDAASAPPATGEARRVTPLEQRRRDALEAKQRRLDGIMSRVAAARLGTARCCRWCGLLAVRPATLARLLLSSIANRARRECLRAGLSR